MSNIEDHIRHAIEEGKFDNLPGKGKPLKLEDDTLTDPEWRLAHHMLRSSGFTLPWIDRRQEIELRLEVARETLRRSWSWRQSAQSRSAADQSFIEAEWQKASDQFQERIQAINQDIRLYNLEAPSERFHLRPVNARRELDLISSSPSGTLQNTNPG